MDVSRSSDEELLADLGVPGHFEELYRRHVGKVTAFATRRCSRAEEVPDLVAAVWLEVIASAHRFDARKGRALPWILGVAANLTASNERRRAREREAIARLGNRPDIDERTADELDRGLDAAREACGVLGVLRTLPVAERLVAELVLIEGLQPRQAADALGIRPATARMRLMRARNKIKRSLTPTHPMTDGTIDPSEA